MLAQSIGERRLGNVRRAERARTHDRRSGARTIAEPRRQRVCQHAAHLTRHTGQHGDPTTTFVLEPDARRGAMPIVENRRTFRNERLLPIALWHRVTESLEPSRFEGAEYRIVHDHAAPEQFGDHGLRAIVGGWSESAGRDHGAGAIERIAHGRRNQRGIVAGSGATHDADADGRQLTREMRRVGVDREAEQQLVADGDDFEVHARNLRECRAERLACLAESVNGGARNSRGTTDGHGRDADGTRTDRCGSRSAVRDGQVALFFVNTPRWPGTYRATRVC